MKRMVKKNLSRLVGFLRVLGLVMPLLDRNELDLVRTIKEVAEKIERMK